MVVSGSGGEISYRAFDGVATDENGIWLGSTTPHYTLLDLGNALLNPTGIRIQKSTWHGLNSFRFEGSNDNTLWTLLYQQDAAQGEWTDRTYNFTTTSPSTASSRTRSVERESKEKILVYPIPAKDHLTFSSQFIIDGPARAHIINNKGTAIDIGALSLRKNENHVIDISSLSNGLYFLIIQQGRVQIRTKFLKE